MNTIHAALTSLVALSVAGTAQADFIDAELQGHGARKTVEVSDNGGGTYYDTPAGSIEWTVNHSSLLGAGESFMAFCIELSQNVETGKSYDFDLVDPASHLGETQADLLSELFGRIFFDFDADEDHKEMAAFQLAVWEITHDEGMNLTDGVFRASENNGLRQLAQSWLNGLDGTGPRANVFALTHQTGQDQIFAAMPTPGALGLLALAGLYGRRRRN